MKIKINETRLKNIISEVIRKVLYETRPKQEMEGFLFEAFFKDKPYIIEEGLIKTYPIDRVIFALSGLFDLYKEEDYTERYKTLYKLDNGEEVEFNGVIEKQSSKNKTNRILIKVKNDNFNQNDFDKYLLKYGWFCASSYKMEGYKNIICFVYEKKFDVEVTDFVNEKRYVYHICPNIYLNKIDNKGLVPKYSSWNVFSNPERVYFLINEPSHEDFTNIALNFAGGKEIYSENDGWSLLKVDVSANKNAKFYFDPRMKGGIYTMDNISPDSIEIIDYINQK